MAKRIRRGILNNGGVVSNVSNIEYTDAYEFDRSRADNEFVGQPVEMSRSGSGSVTLLAGLIPSGYATTDPFITYYDIDVVDGAETVVEKTVTFTKVTYNEGGSIPAEGRGEKRISFDYGESTET